ncbi:MAG: hypothetical protein AB7G80_08595 [Dongiaceae bacterium]
MMSDPLMSDNKMQSLETTVTRLRDRVEILEDQIEELKKSPPANENLFNVKNWDEFKQRLEHYVREKPLQAIGFAMLGTAILVLLLK